MNETLVGLYVGAVTNLLVAAVLNNPPFWEGHPDVNTWLITLGTWNEVLGVLLVASPELLPRVERVLRYIFGRLSSFASRVSRVLRRVLRLPGRRHFASMSSGITLGGSVSTKVMRGTPSGTLEERLKWVIDKVRAHDDRLDNIDEEVSKLPERWKADIEVVRQELEDLSRELVRSTADARIQRRTPDAEPPRDPRGQRRARPLRGRLRLARTRRALEERRHERQRLVDAGRAVLEQVLVIVRNGH